MITYKEFLLCQELGVDRNGEPVCKSCHGSGEVSAGITYTDEHHEVRLVPNPNASEYVLDPNPLVPLWSISICKLCRGTGMPNYGAKSLL